MHPKENQNVSFNNKDAQNKKVSNYPASSPVERKNQFENSIKSEFAGSNLKGDSAFVQMGNPPIKDEFEMLNALKDTN